jgi:SAM-dependent methyltransferase
MLPKDRGHVFMPVMTDEQVAAIPKSTRVLEVGCGQIRRIPGSTTMDVNPGSIADVIHDLNVFPYPFEDNSFDMVVAEHVIEHLDNVIGVTEELHRITKPGGVLYIEVPHFTSSNFFTDPTHRHSFTTRSFDYFVEGKYVSTYNYSKIRFKKRRAELHFVSENRFMRRLHRWALSDPERYERKAAFILQAEYINFELEVVK